MLSNLFVNFKIKDMRKLQVVIFIYNFFLIRVCIYIVVFEINLCGKVLEGWLVNWYIVVRVVDVIVFNGYGCWLSSLQYLFERVIVQKMGSSGRMEGKIMEIYFENLKCN